MLTAARWNSWLGAWTAMAVVASGLLAATAHIRAQVVNASGQNVVPVYEGWRKNSDGSFTMFFGYFSRNSEEQINIPLGSENSFDPPEADRGQPTHFYAKRRQFVFGVVVSKDWGQKDLAWTLTSRGKNEKAY